MSDSRFLRAGRHIIPVADILSIDTQRIEDLHVRVDMKGMTPSFAVNGPDAIDLVMKLCPSVFEGKKMKFIRHQWVVHNLVGHPLMQVLAWLGFPKLGMEIHEKTTPRPVGKKS